MPAIPTDAELAAFADELRKWWSFDDRQFHTHSWHTREDFTKEKLPELLAAQRLEARGEVTEATIERAARAMRQRSLENLGISPAHEWETLSPKMKENLLSEARAALTAALNGEDG
jgi:hypothetical protein